MIALTGCVSGLTAQSEAGNWKWITDGPARLASGEAASDSVWQFAPMPPGWHVTMGPGGVLYDPAYASNGRFALEAEIFLFPGESAEGFGIVVGGRGLEGPAPRYVAFMIRRDGHGVIARRTGGTTTPLTAWTRGDSIVPGGDEPVRNVLRVEAELDSVFLVVNGVRLVGVARSGLEVDGQFGLRAGAGLNLHVSTLDYTQRIAPPRARRRVP